MTGGDVLQVVGCLREAGLRVWLDGGWGVDALLGTQTRPHADLDIVVELEQAAAILDLLAPFGFQLTLDDRPTRFVSTDAQGRRIDFHPIVLDAEGNGRQIGAGANGGDAIYPVSGLSGTGTISGQSVACLTPQLLLLHHTGYEPQPKDRHNVRLLCERFGLTLPRAYRRGARDETGD